MTAMLPHRPSDPPEENLFGPVARLSTLATELAEMPLGPRAAFRSELRSRLLDEAGRTWQDQGPLSPDGPERAEAPHRRRAHYGRRAAVMGLALALAGGGVAAAAEHSLPGEPLYPIKRFDQSVRLALDPSSGLTPSLRLISARISDTERTVALDPSGRDTSRWRAVDSALSDADTRLVRLSAYAPAQELSAALAPDQIRLERLLPAVPVAYRGVVQQLRDTIESLSAEQPVVGAVSLPLGLLPPGGLSPSGALAAGWPLDPATLKLPTPPAAPHPLPQDRTTGRRAGGVHSATASSPSGSDGSSAHETGSNASSSSSAGAGSSGRLPRLPLGTRSSGGTGSTTSRGSVLPRTTSSVGDDIDRTVNGTLGWTWSGSTSTGGKAAGVVDGLVGDATETVSRLPLTDGLSGITSTR